MSNHPTFIYPTLKVYTVVKTTYLGDEEDTDVYVFYGENAAELANDFVMKQHEVDEFVRWFMTAPLDGNKASARLAEEHEDK